MERYSQRHLPPLPEEASGCQDRLQPFSRSGTDQDAATVKNTPFFADPGMKLVGELAAFHLYCLYRTCPQTLVTVLAFCVNRGNYTHVTTFLVADLLVSPLSACRYRRNPTTHRPPVSSLPALESIGMTCSLKSPGTSSGATAGKTFSLILTVTPFVHNSWQNVPLSSTCLGAYFSITVSNALITSGAPLRKHELPTHTWIVTIKLPPRSFLILRCAA